MAATGLLQLLFLILSTIFVVGQLDPVDKICEGSTQCLHKNDCGTYAQSLAEYKTLPKNTCRQKEALAELRGSVCNKAEQGVCCNQCGLGKVCTPQKECPSFAAERNKLIKLNKGTVEYSNLLESIKSRICDKVTKTVCCERADSKCVAPQNSIPVLQSLPSNGCDPSRGSCLPQLGSCGKAGREQRIVGGKDALPGEFPFTALLGRKGKRRVSGVTFDVNQFSCGGTLINLRYVVTAAHCHHRTLKRKQISLVRLGEYEVTDRNQTDCSGPRRDFCLEFPQDFNIKPDDVILHPGYGKERQDKIVNTINDIALIRLPRTASENLAVRVVCLPLQPKVAALQLNVPDIREGLASYYPTVVGWGHTQGDPFNRTFSGSKERVASPIQQKLAVPVVTSETCSEKLFGFISRPDQICAGGEIGKDSCGGDSGGPLYMRYIIEGQKKSAYFDNSKPWYLLGIVSFGTKTCGSGNPAIYTRVESFIPWIQETIRD